MFENQNEPKIKYFTNLDISYKYSQFNQDFIFILFLIFYFQEYIIPNMNLFLVYFTHFYILII